MRRRFLIVAVLMFGSACSGTDGADPTLAPGPTSTATSTTGPTSTAGPTGTSGEPATTSSSAPSTSAASQPTAPLPDPSEEDFPTIWRQLMDYHNWAFANPVQADPREYLDDGCDCLARAEAILAEYLDNGWSAVGDGIIVHSIEVEVETSTFALMTVVDEQSELAILGPDDQVVEVIERRPKTFFDVRVRKTEDGWRITEWNQRGAEGAAE
ncbi:MAG: hypothetical protein HKN91_02360 [Acidimicrobiia bacterium]|nr:hypothetical protein [Acidimicrobiia bacterium]